MSPAGMPPGVEGAQNVNSGVTVTVQPSKPDAAVPFTTHSEADRLCCVQLAGDAKIAGQ